MTVRQLANLMQVRYSLAGLADQDLIELVADEDTDQARVAIAAQLLAERAWPSPRCQHPGCSAEGMECQAGEETERYCPGHAREHGYCRGCGQFWAGTQTFEEKGLCATCKGKEGWPPTASITPTSRSSASGPGSSRSAAAALPSTRT